mmetsp:Transcript_1113/g.2557  ORF Transcript_1113/g.2557 Transcript_1113/m.2557 type:complete len:566 (+) Transcript_1113:69-1766(+)
MQWHKDSLMLSVATIALLGAPVTVLGTPVWNVEVDVSKVIRVSRTLTSLQVVSNPIMDRTFTAPNGTKFPNPIHENAWGSLAALGADVVRYVPWYPYPKKSVAELDAPVDGKPTSWDFTHIMPMLEDFMNATYGQGHSVTLNFATQPCWLFGDANNKTQNCSYPANPDQTDFTYAKGYRDNLLDPTSQDMAGYFSRLLAYLVKGEFTDEHGVKHTGGPAYSKFNRANGHVWEFFNEPATEHAYKVEQYIHDYSVIVPQMIEAVGGYDNAPAFMGIGGASNAWTAPFLDGWGNYSSVPPIDYISMHHYSGCTNRTDPSTYSSGFFNGAKAFIDDLKIRMAERDASPFPHVKIALNEMGVIMPDDNNPNFGLDGNLPDIYWNAAGAMYAHMFGVLAPMGVEVLGHSQLAGSPPIPEWGIPLAQFPSVSLLDWRTGFGNARYWALKILIEEFAPGDKIVTTEWNEAGKSLGVDDQKNLTCMASVKPDGTRKLLLVNHINDIQLVKVAGFADGAALSLKIVDQTAVTSASAHGIRTSSASAGEPIAMQPFAIIVASAKVEETEWAELVV